MPFDPSLLLFVPADRPDRFGKALASDASGAILDLEDAVSPDRKAFARDQVRAFLNTQDDLDRVAIRINPAETPDGHADLEMLATVPRPAALVVPKVSRTGDVLRITAAVGDVPLIPIIETAGGVVRCVEIAETDEVLALAFGPYDLAAELGGESTEDVM
ncbi:MAG TPA: aldolase/citrate lyase family protein, partial [Candidatus Elarobacter sp.]